MWLYTGGVVSLICNLQRLPKIGLQLISLTEFFNGTIHITLTVDINCGVEFDAVLQYVVWVYIYTFHSQSYK